MVRRRTCRARDSVQFSTKPRLCGFGRGLCGAQVLVADSDDEVVDHASLLNSFGNDNTNIITPVPRMHSIKPEWDEDVRADSIEIWHCCIPSSRLFENRRVRVPFIRSATGCLEV